MSRNNYPFTQIITIIVLLFCFGIVESKAEKIIHKNETAKSEKIGETSGNKSIPSSTTIENQTILKLLNKIYFEFTKNQLTFSWWWGIISGLASILGLIAAIYFYMKSKKADEIMLGFFDAISAESHSILNELSQIKNIDAPERYIEVRAKIETAHNFMASLNHTIFVFKKTLWPSKKEHSS